MKTKFFRLGLSLFLSVMLCLPINGQGTSEADEEELSDLFTVLNYLHASLSLPSETDAGTALTWAFEPSGDEVASYVVLGDNELTVLSLPSSSEGALMAGTLKVETEDGSVSMEHAVRLAPDDERYGYLYCYMNSGEEITNYALGSKEDKGKAFYELLDGAEIFDTDEIAEIEGGTRDAFIGRGEGSDGYFITTTDMCNATSGVWNNYGINLLSSPDLIHWEGTTFDFREGPSIFSDSTESTGVYEGDEYENIRRVWAPQFIYDEEAEAYLVYYSILSNNDGDDYDRIFYSYTDNEFKTLTQPRLLYDPGISVIDADIFFNPYDSLYHMFYKYEGASDSDRGIYEATSESLTGGEWTNILHVTNEGTSQVEGSSAIRRINEDVYNLYYMRYSNGSAYKYCELDNLGLNPSSSAVLDGTGDFQHGSFMTLTEEEYTMLQAWSDLMLYVDTAEEIISDYISDTTYLKAILNAYNALQLTSVSELAEALPAAYETLLNSVPDEYVLGNMELSLSDGECFLNEADTIEVTFPNLEGITKDYSLSESVEVTITDADGNSSIATVEVNSEDDGFNIITGITALGSYTITIPTGLFGSSETSNEAVTLSITVIEGTGLTEDFTGYISTIVDGETLYLSRGANWGTHAVADSYGLSVVASQAKSTVSTVYFQDNQSYLYLNSSSSVYTDNSSNNSWIIRAETEDGSEYYTIQAANEGLTEGYLYVDTDNNNILSLTTDESSAAHWALTEASVRDAAIAEKEEAQTEAAFEAAGFEYEKLSDYFTTQVQTDLSSISETWNSDDQNGSTTSESTIWSDTYSVSEGLYKISLYAFERIGGGSSNDAERTGELYFAGYNDVTAYLYANDNKVQLANIFEPEQSTVTDGEPYTYDGTTYYVPNSTTTATTFFDAGYYENELYVYVDNNDADNLTIGLNYTSYASNRWVAYQYLTVTKIDTTESFTGYLATTVGNETLYLSRGANWGTRAVVDNYGLSVVIPSPASSLNTIYFQDNSNYLYQTGTSVYTDASSNNNWTFTQVGTDDDGNALYTIAAANNSDEGYLYVDTTANNVVNISSTETPAQWTLVSNAARDAAIEAKEEAQNEAAFTEAGFDYSQRSSYTLTEAETDLSSISETWNANDKNGGTTSESTIWSDTYSVSEGLYKISLYAFERIGGGSNDATRAGDLYFAGYDDVTAYLYANDNQVQLANIHDPEQDSITSGDSYEYDGTTYYVPSNTSTATTYFNAGYYENVIYVYVDNNDADNLEIGLNYTSYASNRWMPYQYLTISQVTESIKQTEEYMNLDSLIAVCNAYADNSTLADEQDNTVQATFASAIDAAETVRDDETSDVDDFEDAYDTLEAARQTYVASGEAYPTDESSVTYNATFLIGNSVDNWEREHNTDTGTSTYTPDGSDVTYVQSYSASHFTGSVMEQSVEAPNGYYNVTIQVAASKAWISQVVTDGTDSCTVLYANNKTTAVEVYNRNSVTADDVVCYTLDSVKVSNDTLTIGIENLYQGANWHIAYIDSVLLIGALHASDYYAALQELTSNPIEKVNVGDNAFQIPTSAYEALTNAYTTAEAYTEETATAEAIETLKQAIDDYYAAELNEPDTRVKVIMNADGFTYDGYAWTNIPSTTTLGNYDMQWWENTNYYAQALTFEAVEDDDAELNTFIISYLDADDTPHYLCTGTSLGSTVSWGNEQLRMTTKKDSALNVIVEASYTTEGLWRILNTADNTYIGSNGNQSVYTAENYSNLTIEEATEDTVTLNVTNAEWATLILPYNANLQDGLTVYTITGAEDYDEDEGITTLAYEAVESIAANTPYLVNSSPASYTFTGYGQATATSYEDTYMTGTLVKTTAPDYTYVLQNQADYGVAFYYVSPDSTITVGANRAYISTVPEVDSSENTSMRALLLIEDNTTGIESATNKANTDADENEPVNVYSISGILMRLNVKASEALDNLPKGVYIVNGKKQLIK